MSEYRAPHIERFESVGKQSYAFLPHGETVRLARPKEKIVRSIPLRACSVRLLGAKTEIPVQLRNELMRPLSLSVILFEQTD
jgi:hypothetical protein